MCLGPIHCPIRERLINIDKPIDAFFSNKLFVKLPHPISSLENFQEFYFPATYSSNPLTLELLYLIDVVTFEKFFSTQSQYVSC